MYQLVASTESVLILAFVHVSSHFCHRWPEDPGRDRCVYGHSGISGIPNIPCIATVLAKTACHMWQIHWVDSDDILTNSKDELICLQCTEVTEVFDLFEALARSAVDKMSAEKHSCNGHGDQAAAAA